MRRGPVLSRQLTSRGMRFRMKPWPFSGYGERCRAVPGNTRCDPGVLPVRKPLVQLRHSFMPRKSQQDIQLVGRDADLDFLRSELASARRGDGGLVFIHGEPGIGKTALVQAFASEAVQSGTALLWGRGYDGAWLPPYAPWLEALADLPGDAIPAGLTDALS